MKKLIYIITVLLFSFSLKAQYSIIVNNSGNTMYASPVSTVESITFDGTYSKILTTGSTSSLNIQKSLVESFTFSSITVNLTKIYIIYNGSDDATIINPYASQGVNITAVGGNVTVAATSGIANLEYNLLGTTSSGFLSMSSDQPANFVLNNANITNPNGAAIQITGSQTHTFSLTTGTTNSLKDGSASTKNGALQTASPIIFNGTGSLNITGIKKHGISTTSSVTVESGNITINSATSDGLHSEGFIMSGGNFSVTSSTGDGIDAGDANIAVSGGTINVTSTSADVKAIKTGAGTIDISGGTITANVSGAQSKALSSSTGNINFNGGTFTVNVSSAAVLVASGSGYDPSYGTAIKTDGIFTQNNGNINLTLTSAANGGRGISTVAGIVINGGNLTITTAGNGAVYTNELGVTDSYSSSCLKSDGYINVIVGTVNLTSSGTAGKGINADGTITIGSTTSSPTINVTTTGARFLVTGTDYAHPKTMVANGAITINNGNNTINSTDDGVHSDTSITINGGTNSISAISATSGVGEGIEAPIINLAGGTNNVNASNDGINATYTSNHFLRGRQTTDANGLVNFTSIFPGWYSGRATHIHVHVYKADGTSLLVTQIAFPEGSNSAVVLVNASTAKGYTKGMSGYTYNSNDNVFSDGTANEMSAITGSVSAGFALTHTIKVSA